MGTTPDEVRAEIEATRARLEEELDQLSEKIRPGKVATRTAHDARVAASRAASTVREQAGQNPAVASVRRKAHDRADHTAAAVRDRMEAHPQVALSAQKARETTRRAALAVREQAERNPQVSAGVLGAASVTLIMVVALVVARHRGRPRTRPVGTAQLLG